MANPGKMTGICKTTHIHGSLLGFVNKINQDLCYLREPEILALINEASVHEIFKSFKDSQDYFIKSDFHSFLIVLQNHRGACI